MKKIRLLIKPILWVLKRTPIIKTTRTIINHKATKLVVKSAKPTLRATLLKLLSCKEVPQESDKAPIQKVLGQQ